MIDFCLGRINRKQMTIDEVPAYWRKAVQEALDRQNNN